jgi:hypothetical protein
VAERPIRVEGSGIAALCCLQLLKTKRYTALPAIAKSSRLPAILISPSTQKLLADIFCATDLFDRFPVIRERVVAWGSGEPVRLPHSGVVGSEKALLDRLNAKLGERSGPVDVTEASSNESPRRWTIFTALGSQSQARETGFVEQPHRHFGSRMATVREVELAESAPTDTCWIESVEDGWLFLLPIGARKGSLISVGRENHAGLLAKSRLVGQWVRSTDDTRVAKFAAYPRIATRLGGPGWMVCGSAAMAFDPLCGEGAGNAARETILACAAVGAMQAGEPSEDVLAEYEMRLRLGFLRHLENCREFYTQASRDEFWDGELRAIDEGIAWTKGELKGGPGPRYRLVGFGLERLG